MTVDVAVLSGGVGAARFLRGLVQVVDAGADHRRSSTPATTPCSTACRSPPTSTRSPTRSPAPSTPSAGWGLAGETWQAMEALARYDRVRPAGSAAATTWFNLGDRDLATHLYRTRPPGRGRHADRRRRRDRAGRGASASGCCR